MGPYFFIFGKLKWGTLGDRLFFFFPYLFGDLANNEIWGEKNKKHGERERAVAERGSLVGWDQDPARCLTKPMPLQCSKKKNNAVAGTDDVTEAHTGNAVQTSESPY